MSVAQFVNHGEKFDNCDCANKWEWVSVNCSWICLVGRRREKLLGHSKLRLVVQVVFKNN